MLRMRSCFLHATVVCFSLLALGCGSGAVPVKGVVTFDGKPLANAAVMFLSQEPRGKDAASSTDSAGAFTVSALPGAYKVTVHYSEAPKVAEQKTPEDWKKAVSEAPAVKPSIVIPPVYTDKDKTPFQYTVPVDGTVKLDLTSTKP